MPKVFTKRLFNQRGITLIELIAVILIIGIISAVGVPAVFNQIENAKEKRDVANIAIMHEALERYATINRTYPQLDNAITDDIVAHYLENPDDNATLLDHLLKALTSRETSILGSPYLRDDFPRTDSNGNLWVVNVIDFDAANDIYAIDSISKQP